MNAVYFYEGPDRPQWYECVSTLFEQHPIVFKNEEYQGSIITAELITRSGGWQGSVCLGKPIKARSQTYGRTGAHALETHGSSARVYLERNCARKEQYMSAKEHDQGKG